MFLLRKHTQIPVQNVSLMEMLLGELSQSSHADIGTATSNETVNEDPVAILQRRLRLEINLFRHLKRRI